MVDNLKDEEHKLLQNQTSTRDTEGPSEMKDDKEESLVETRKDYYEVKMAEDKDKGDGAEIEEMNRQGVPGNQGMLDSGNQV